MKWFTNEQNLKGWVWSQKQSRSIFCICNCHWCSWFIKRYKITFLVPNTGIKAWVKEMQTKTLTVIHGKIQWPYLWTECFCRNKHKTKKKNPKNQNHRSTFSSEGNRSASDYSMIMCTCWPPHNATSLDMGWVRLYFNQLHAVWNLSSMTAKVFFSFVHHCIISA